MRLIKTIEDNKSYEVSSQVEEQSSEVQKPTSKTRNLFNANIF